jgi:hypothetical protein
MSLASAATVMFRMMEEKASKGEISIAIIKIGCINFTSERPHEFTPYEAELIREPAKFIVEYAGQKINLFVLACDSTYGSEKRHPELFKNDDYYKWAVDGVYNTCVIPVDVTDGDVQQIFAEYDIMKLPLSSMVLMHFAGGFQGMSVENPKVFMNLPTDCFTDVNALVYNVAFNIKDGEMFPFKIENSPDGLAFVNNSESCVTHFDAVTAMIQQFMFTQRKKFYRLKKIFVAANGSAHVCNRQPVTERFSKANSLKNSEVMEHLYKMLGDVEIRQFFEPIVNYWLESKNDDDKNIIDVLRTLYVGVISDISKVSSVAELCAGDKDTIECCLRIVKNIESTFEFKTTTGTECYMG